MDGEKIDDVGIEGIKVSKECNFCNTLQKRSQCELVHLLKPGY